MIKIALCLEEEEYSTHIIREMQKSFSQKGVMITIVNCHNADELISKTGDNFCPDILLYNINGEHGRIRKAALSLKRRNRNLISIITERTDYINFKDNLLLQPIYTLPSRSREQLWSYLCKTYHLLLSDADTFTYYHRPEYATVTLNEVLYFTSEGRRVNLITKDGTDSFYHKLDEVEQILQTKNCRFVRVHKSYLVNTHFISNFDHKSLTLATGETLNISRYHYYKEISQLLNAPER